MNVVLTKLNLKIREKIKAKYWEMGDKTRQREFILRYAIPGLPKYKIKMTNFHRKLNNMAYYFELEEIEKQEYVKICLNQSLIVSDQIIRNCFNKLDSEGVLMPLQQGKHSQHKQISKGLKKGVKSY